MGGDLYLQRGIKKEQGGHRKAILWIAFLFVLGILIAPFLWVHRHPAKVANVPVVSRGDADGGTSRQITTGKVPKVITVPSTEAVTAEDRGKAPAGEGGAQEPEEQHTSPPTTLSPSPESSMTAASSTQIVPKENPYEIRADLERQQQETEKRARETVAQSAVKEMPLSSGGLAASSQVQGKGTVLRGKDEPGKKHTIATLITPERGQKNPETPPPSPTTGSPKSATVEKEATTSKKPPTTPQTSAAIKPATPSPLSPPPPPNLSSSGESAGVTHWIQVGAYTEEANATRAKSTIEKLGYQVVVKPSTHPRLGNIYVVRVPIKGSKEDAQKAASAIARKTGDKPFIVESR